MDCEFSILRDIQPCKDIEEPLLLNALLVGHILNVNGRVVAHEEFLSITIYSFLEVGQSTKAEPLGLAYLRKIDLDRNGFVEILQQAVDVRLLKTVFVPRNEYLRILRVHLFRSALSQRPIVVQDRLVILFPHGFCILPFVCIDISRRLSCMQVFTKGCIWQISTDGNLSAGVSESVYSNATVDYSIYFIVTLLIARVLARETIENA